MSYYCWARQASGSYHAHRASNDSQSSCFNTFIASPTDTVEFVVLLEKSEEQKERVLARSRISVAELSLCLDAQGSHHSKPPQFALGMQFEPDLGAAPDIGQPPLPVLQRQ